MLRLFLPVLLVGSAIALFVLYTNPTYQKIKGLSLQNKSYTDALDKAQKLGELRGNLLAKRNSFQPADLEKIQHILPDNVDNIRLIIDINNIASRHGLTLTNVSLGTLDKNGGNPADTSATPGTPIGSVDVGFSISTNNYDTFLAFLQDLEHSLRLLDVMSLAFSANPEAGTGQIAYTFTVRTYWLR